MKALALCLVLAAATSGCATPAPIDASLPTLTTEQLKAAAVDGQLVRLDGFLTYHEGAVSGTGKFYDLGSAEPTIIRGKTVLRCSASAGSLVLLPAERIPQRLVGATGQHVILSARYHRADMPVQWEAARQDYLAFLTDIAVEQVLPEHCHIFMVASQRP